MDLKGGKRGERGIVEDRLMKRKIELRKREKRRKNIILKGMEMKNGKRREAV